MLAQVVRGPRPAPGVPEGAISIVTGGDRDELRQIATQDGVVDLIIPRGGEGLKAALKEHATVPVMYAAAGNCHVFVDATADLDDAVAIAVNAKVQRPSVCNAAETLLVHADVAAEFLPRVLRELRESRGGAARGRPHARAGRASWPTRWPRPPRRTGRTEYHALILAVKVVDSARGGDRAREPLRLGAFGGDRDRVHRVRAGVHRGRGRGLRLRQRLHALHGRRACSAWAPRSATRPRSSTRAARSALRELTTYKFVIEGSGQVRE